MAERYRTVRRRLVGLRIEHSPAEAPPPIPNWGGSLPARIAQSTGTNYYVATNGSNSNNGLTTGTPWLTIQHALATVPLNGSIINVRGGTYNVGNATWSRNGNSSNPVTLQAYPGETPVFTNFGMGSGLTGSYLRVKGFTITSGVTGFKPESGAHHLDFDGITISGMTNMPFLIGSGSTTAEDIQIWNCRIHSNGDGSPAPNEDHAIYSQNSRRLTIANCLIYNQDFGYGIQIYPSSVANENVIVTCCTIDEQNRSPFVLGGTNGVRIIGCIGTTSASGYAFLNVDQGPGSNIQVQDSVAFGLGSPAFPASAGVSYTNNITSNPLYVNRTGRDYHIPSTSPAFNRAAARTEWIPPLDIDGNPRVTADAGCYRVS